MLKKVIIKNYKQFEDFIIELNDDVNIIIGNNEAGKTTLFEAINLGLTSKLYGKHISQELSPYLFNINSVKKYVSDLQSGKKVNLPEILIELYFGEDFDASFKGTNNSLNENCSGIYLRIAFDKEFEQEYKEYIENPNEIKTIPVEYYSSEWYSFANSCFKFTQVPITSHLINNIEHRYMQGPDKYIASLIEYSLERKQNALLALKYRKLKEEFANDDKIKEINDTFSSPEYEISDKKVVLSLDISAKSNWDSNLCLYLDDVPFKYIGKGEQNCIKTKLAIKSKADNSDLIMIEEPETSLSFSNLNKLTKHIQDCCKGKQLLINTHSSYIMNKTGIDKAILLNGKNYFSIKNLNKDTYEYFKKLPGYDTLRMILSQKAILVEGPSDELIIQKAYLDKYAMLPIEAGIDVISVKGLSFKRFLDIAKIVSNQIVVVTDNDGDVKALEDKYKDYEYPNIKICYSKDEKLKTLEPQILASNNTDEFKKIFTSKKMTNEQFEKYFTSSDRKTEVALKIFETAKGTVNFPQYINDAII